MLFPDILITPCEDGSLATTVFRKPTHTDLYVQWGTHHAISSKYSVIGTLHHRANTTCSSPKLVQKEEHLQRILTRCKYRVKMKIKTLGQKNQKKNKTYNTGHQQQNPHIVVPYCKGLSKSLKRTCNKYGVQVYFKGGNIIRSLLMVPKDKDPILKKSGIIYRYNVTGWSVMKNI